MEHLADGYYEYKGYEILQYEATPSSVAEYDKYIFMYGVKEVAEYTGFGYSVKDCQAKIDKLG